MPSFASLLLLRTRPLCSLLVAAVGIAMAVTFAPAAHAADPAPGDTTLFDVAAAPGNDLPTGLITAGPDGSLWVAVNNTIYSVSTTGQVSAGYPLPDPQTFVTDLTAGEDGNVWFTVRNDATAAVIGRITPSGVITMFTYTEPSDSLGNPIPLSTAAITWGPDHQIWVAMAGSWVMHVDPAHLDATPQWINYDASHWLYANDIITGADGALWIFNQYSGASSPSYIGRITTAGETAEFPERWDFNAMDAAVGPDNNIYVSNSFGSIDRIALDGTLTEISYTGDNPDGGGGVASGMAVDPHGDLWASTGSALRRTTTMGTTDPHLIAGLGSLDGVGDVVFGPDGNLWFPIDSATYNPETQMYDHTLKIGRMIAMPPFTARLTTTDGVNGKVGSDTTPTKLECTADGTSCTSEFLLGTSAEVITTPDNGYQFDTWTGDCAGQTANPCPLTMDADKTVSATFAPAVAGGGGGGGGGGGTGPTQTLSFTQPVGGSITADQPQTCTSGGCTASYPQGASADLFVSADYGYEFDHWTGDCAGQTSNGCLLTMDVDHSVGAVMRKLPTYTLTVKKSGTGAAYGALTVNGVGCNSGCVEQIPVGANVTVTATNGTKARFTQWSSVSCDWTDNAGKSCELSMVSPRTVTATFQAAVRTDDLAKTASGKSYAGDNVYSSTAKGEVVGEKVSRGSAGSYDVKIANDGFASGVFKVKAPTSVSGMHIRYFAGTTEVTSKVLAGTYAVTLGAGKSVVLTAKVSVPRTVAAGKVGAAMLSTTCSASGITSVDAVVLKTTAS